MKLPFKLLIDSDSDPVPRTVQVQHTWLSPTMLQLTVRVETERKPWKIATVVDKRIVAERDVTWKRPFTFVYRLSNIKLMVGSLASGTALGIAGGLVKKLRR